MHTIWAICTIHTIWPFRILYMPYRQLRIQCILYEPNAQYIRSGPFCILYMLYRQLCIECTLMHNTYDMGHSAYYTCSIGNYAYNAYYTYYMGHMHNTIWAILHIRAVYMPCRQLCIQCILYGPYAQYIRYGHSAYYTCHTGNYAYNAYYMSQMHNTYDLGHSAYYTCYIGNYA